MGRVIINREYCKGCGLCTMACPGALISIGREFNTSGYCIAVFRDDKGACTGCALCAEMCPDIAIEVWK